MDGNRVDSKIIIWRIRNLGFGIFTRCLTIILKVVKVDAASGVKEKSRKKGSYANAHRFFKKAEQGE